MNLLVAYAKLPMSFRNLYQRRHDGGGKSLVAIASALTGLLIVNIWSLLLLVSLIDHGWSASRRRPGHWEFGALCAGVFVVEMILVDRIFARVHRDKGFADRVISSSQRISKWYAGISIGLFAVATIVKIGMDLTAIGT